MAVSVSKANKHALAALTSIGNRLTVARQYSKLWQDYFKFFADGFDDRKIFDQDEQNFLMLMNVLAQNQFRFTEFTSPHFKDGDALVKLMCDTPSLTVMKGMSEAQFSKVLVDWHTLFISMNKAIGKLNQAHQVSLETKK